MLDESNNDCATGALSAPTLGFSASSPLGGLQVCALEADDSWHGGFCARCPGLIAEVCTLGAEAPVSVGCHIGHVKLHAVVPEGLAGLAWSKDPGKSSARLGHSCADPDASDCDHANLARLHTGCFVGLAGQARSEDPSTSSTDLGHRSAKSAFNAASHVNPAGLHTDSLVGLVGEARSKDPTHPLLTQGIGAPNLMLEMLFEIFLPGCTLGVSMAL